MKVSTVLFSRPCTYAIRALTYLAMQPPGRLCGTREISKHEDIPSPYLCKVLLQLRRGRLLRSYKGIGGGYELAQPPDKINLLMIVTCLEGDVAINQCILEDQKCSSQQVCPLHDSWLELREQFVRFLEVHTLADLVHMRQMKEETRSQSVPGVAGLPGDQVGFLSSNTR